ncbi:hypothetical protein Hypma_002108 [Hypsizygus marmoreus]|uniref:Uncharacterized protein n=1 Tax=Hypsizygus marmoreus TaxID=39966 RepID=A0A369K3A3_HYPMA|nr:hypothetical protein Hypma_002108 [Hypsizygus marmoreus]
MSSSDDENHPPSSHYSQQPRESALRLGPRKKPSHSDPLIHNGRHFGRTVNALCNVPALLTNGIAMRTAELLGDAEAGVDDHGPVSSEDSSREFRVFKSLLKIAPTLEERVMTCSQEELRLIGDLIQKGSCSARSDDTKSLKSAVIDWITPRNEPLIPPLPRNVKSCRGFHHEATGALLCPANLDWSDPEVKTKLRDGEYIVPGDQWPILIYKDYKYDPNDPWAGLLRSKILVYVRFALSSSPVFCRTDIATDSQRFYDSIIEFLEDPMEKEEVSDLLTFWNRTIFPAYASAKRPITKDSVLSRLKERRAAAALSQIQAATALTQMQGGSAPRHRGL